MSTLQGLKIKQCPICDSELSGELKSLELGSFDSSFLYKSIELVCCSVCGHVYNRLRKEECDNIIKFYKTEHEELDGGSTHKDVIEKRNSDFYNVLKNYCGESSKILDLGCGEGDFLKYLIEKRYTDLSGFDLENFCEDKTGYPYEINIGNAEILPYENNLFDALVLDQFLEHVINPKKVLQEAFRVTKYGGVAIVGIPNAKEYNKYNMFPLFYVILREHIQHFDIDHLTMLANDIGFTVKKVVETIFPMQAMNMPMANIYVVLKKNKVCKKQEVNKLDLKSKMINYLNINDTKLLLMKEKILEYINFGKTIYFWGIGREFFLIYSMLSTEQQRGCRFIDANKRKQRSQKIDGIDIIDGSELAELKQDNIAVAITAVYHTKVIERYLLDINFCGDIIKIFEFKD